MSLALDEAAKGNGSGPDPSNATTQMMLREVGALKELFEQRLIAMDRAVDLKHENVTRWPTDLEREVSTINKLIEVRLGIQEEKFKGIDLRFTERDLRIEQASRDDKKAIDAALMAAKESVGKQNEASDKAITKQEAAFVKQIDQQNLTLVAVKAELDQRINDNKERIGTLLATQTGGIETRKESRESIGTIVGVAGFVFALIGVVGSFLINR